jgi:multidrug efflux pump subunit AcrA (membrane-fusion protein)
MLGDDSASSYTPRPVWRHPQVIAAFITLFGALLVAIIAAIAVNRHNENKIDDLTALIAAKSVELERLQRERDPALQQNRGADAISQQQLSAERQRTQQLQAQVNALNAQLDQLQKTAPSATVTTTSAVQRAFTQTTRPSADETHHAEAQTPSQTPVLTGESLGVKASLIKCARRGGDVLCEFTVVSPKENTYFDLAAQIYGVRSRLIDDQGVEHIALNAIIGRDESYSVYTNLAAGIPLRAALRFDDVQSAVSRVELLEIGFTNNKHFGLIQLKHFAMSD